MRKFLYLFLFLFLASCSRDNSSPKSSSDSLLQKPLDPIKDTVALPKPKAGEWYVDATRIRTPEHLALMKRFKPLEVLTVYHDFKPLRKSNVNPESAEVKKFIEQKKITLDELKAILEEGDRLGWSKTP
jgi:hypothetical protein